MSNVCICLCIEKSSNGAKRNAETSSTRSAAEENLEVEEISKRREEIGWKDEYGDEIRRRRTSRKSEHATQQTLWRLQCKNGSSESKSEKYAKDSKNADNWSSSVAEERALRKKSHQQRSDINVFPMRIAQKHFHVDFIYDERITKVLFECLTPHESTPVGAIHNWDIREQVTCYVQNIGLIFLNFTLT